MNLRDFTDLDVYKESRIFRNEMFELTRNFPKDEKYILTDQLVRASRSIAANIAEGYGRFHYQENIQYCRIARGSLSECYEHLICAYDCKYIDEETLKKYKTKIDRIGQMLNGYIRYLQKRKNE